VHRYLLFKTLLSAGNTLAAYAVLKILGVDFAETWALLTFFLNFIPKIGSITATVLPSLFALLQFQEFQPVFLTVVGLAVVHGLTGEVIEPMVMGKSAEPQLARHHGGADVLGDGLGGGRARSSPCR
jgi:AI-2 transport protein TqsA